MVESHFDELAKLIEKYAKTIEKLGRKGNTLSNAILSSFEDLENPRIATQAAKFTSCLTSVQTDREAFASELCGRIAEDFRVYETKCSEIKKEANDHNHLTMKEHNEKADLLRLQNRFPADKRKIMETKVRLEKAEIMSRNSRSLLHQQMEEFEEQKLSDSGRILREFVRMEMQFHARSLQTYTKAFQHLMKIPDHLNDNSVYKISDEKNEQDSNSTLNSVTVVKSKEKHVKEDDSKLSINDLF
jgi:hypothetical protein